MMGVALGIGVWLGVSIGGGADRATDVSMGVSLVYVSMERSGWPNGKVGAVEGLCEG